MSANPRSWPFLLAALGALTMSGCAHMIAATIACDERRLLAAPELDAQAKKMTPGSGKALIYVYRNEALACDNKTLVTLDGQVAGQTGQMTYFMWVVDPGEHEVAALTPMTIARQIPTTAKLQLAAEAGKTYFVWQEMKFGGGFQLRQVDDARGRAAVAQCNLIKSQF